MINEEGLLLNPPHNSYYLYISLVMNDLFLSHLDSSESDFNSARKISNAIFMY